MSRHFEHRLLVFSIPENNQVPTQSDHRSMSQITQSDRTERRALTAGASHAVYRFQNHKPGMEGPASRSSEVDVLSCRTVSVIYQGLIGRIVYCQLLPCAIVRLRVLSIHFHTDINNFLH